MKKLVILSSIIMVFFVSTAYAKRGVPKKVKTVVSGKIEYRAHRDQMGCVEAWQGDKILWNRQIYVVKYNLDLELDVQDVFIKAMVLKGKVLIVTNERKSVYHLNLETLEVKVIEGSLVETK